MRTQVQAPQHLRLSADSVAEWSKALRLGRNPKGRGFEPHRCHLFSAGRTRSHVSLTCAGISLVSSLGWRESKSSRLRPRRYETDPVKYTPPYTLA